MTVWVAVWQLQCCGEPCEVGSRVSWTVTKNPNRGWLSEVLGPDIAAKVDAFEDHHSDANALPVTGTVSSITAVQCRYAPIHIGAVEHRAVPGSGVLVPVNVIDEHNAEHEDHHCAGYLVHLVGAWVGAHQRPLREP